MRSVMVFVVSCGGAAATTLPAHEPAASPALVRIAEQCARVASCADLHESNILRTPAGCVDWYLVNARDEVPLAECVMKARSCGDLQACTHARADEAAESFCKAHPGVLSACEGATLVTCEGASGAAGPGEGAAESTAVDCATLGGTCAERRSGGLVVRGCASPTLCPAGAPEHRCAGSPSGRRSGVDAVIDCTDGVAETSECPPGWRCTPDTDAYGSPTARCRSASGRECSIAGGAFCEGDVANVCVMNGRFTGLHSSDCGAYGLGCTVRSGHVSCIQRGPATCAAEPASCSGSELRFCAAGQPFQVDCKKLGFHGCDPSGGGGEALCR